MRKIKKVNVLEVKRCFVVSQLVRKQKFKKRYLGLLSQKEFLKKLKISKKKTFSYSEKKLDKIIADEWKKRLKAYNSCDWFIGEVKINEVGVWKKAGGLPLSWTDGLLKETAQKVKDAFNKNPKLLTKRARQTIPNILKTNVKLLQKEKYLLPIVFVGGTGTRGRKKLKRQTQYDIDDGCIRSVALAVSGLKTIKAYIGFTRN